MNKKNRVRLGVVGVLVFIGSMLLGLYLLFNKNLSGTEFVAFTVAFAVLGAIVGFAPEVQEFSIAGNVVKLREMKQDVREAVEGLKLARTELLRSGIRKIYGDSSRRHEALADQADRNIEFWAIVELARKFEILPKLKEELLKSIKWLRHCEKTYLLWTHLEDRVVDGFDDLTAVEYAVVVNRPAIRSFISNSIAATQIDLIVGKVCEELSRLENLKRELDLMGSPSAQ